uniref:Uncharacterized protein n=1 Tax=Onchocerca volvulus TaxID=6282 RepID=A0A8R1TRW6_ONCVO
MNPSSTSSRMWNAIIYHISRHQKFSVIAELLAKDRRKRIRIDDDDDKDESVRFKMKFHLFSILLLWYHLVKNKFILYVRIDNIHNCKNYDIELMKYSNLQRLLDEKLFEVNKHIDQLLQRFTIIFELIYLHRKNYPELGVSLFYY